MKLVSVFSVAAVALLSGCASHDYVVGGPDAPPAKSVYHAVVQETVSEDDFLTAAGSNTVLFDTNSAYLNAPARETLDRQAAWLITHRGTPALVEGHCDERASKGYNLELGRRRARAVIDYFVAKGIPRERFTARSFGEGKPIVDQRGDVQINRRAVTVVLDHKTAADLGAEGDGEAGS